MVIPMAWSWVLMSSLVVVVVVAAEWAFRLVRRLLDLWWAMQ